MYGLLAWCVVKMVGYWPSSFCVFVWLRTKRDSRFINTPKKNYANIQPS